MASKILNGCSGFRKSDGLVDYLGLPRLEILPWPSQPDRIQQESAYDQVLLSKMTVTQSHDVMMH